ncbi:hypothetical protein GC176_14520 [bacterium]|nr:hypothetical protein [bacterium]
MPDNELIFHGAVQSIQFWMSLAVCFGAAWLIVLLMRYERQLVSRGVGFALLSLRLTVLVVLLLTFLQPTMTRTINRDRTGRVIVAVDVSESMDTVDEYATNAELLRWARAAGVVGNQAVADRLDAWVAAWESGNEPAWVDESEAATPARRAELAALRKQNIEQVLETVRKLPRREIARRLLTETQQPLLDELAKVAVVELRVFASQSEPVVMEGAGDALTNLPPALSRSSTNLALSLEATAGSESAPLAGVIVLSDGRHTADSDPLEAASRLSLLGVPAIPVLIGSEQRPKDISIQSLDYPQVVFLNDSLSVRVRAFADGYAGEELNLTMAHSDGTQEVRSLTVPATGPALLDERFELIGDEAGRHEYQLTVDGRPDETRDDNNARTFSINVVDDRSRVLLVDSEARWDFRYLQTAFSRDERITVTPVIFNQPYLGVLPDTFFSRRLPFDPRQANEQQSPLADFDLLVIGDVSPREFSPDVWAIVEHWVRDLGGTLVLAAGRDAMPRAHRAPALDRLLPVSQLRELAIHNVPPDALPNEMGFTLALTDDGADEDILRLDVDAIANRRLWQSLPGHFWGLTGTARPSASVLMTAQGLPDSALGPQPSTLTPLKRERQTGILVHQYYGFGQVLWLGIDSTWRWRQRRGDELHHRFWGQIARWATRNKAAAGNDVVRLSLSNTQVEPDEPVTVRAIWQKRFLDQNPDLKASVEFVRTDAKASDEPPLRIELTATERRPELFEGMLPTLPPGAWTARLVSENADLGAPVQAELFVSQQRTVETADLAANRALLARIADASGGRLLLPDQIHEALSVLKLPEDAAGIRQERALWDHWVVMLTFFTLLTAEWILRKLNGLP